MKYLAQDLVHGKCNKIKLLLLHHCSLSMARIHICITKYGLAWEPRQKSIILFSYKNVILTRTNLQTRKNTSV